MKIEEMASIGLKEKKDETLTFIQVICAFAVITLHTNGQFWTFSATERYWVTANIIESVFYFAVPIFFMITGITLINYQDRYSTAEYYKKRIVKTFFPYIAWSFIGLAYSYKINGQTEVLDFKYVINGLLSGKIINVYWFFPVLFCIYLSFPLFAAVDKTKRKFTFQYLCIVGFLVNILVPFIINVTGIDLIWPYSVGVVSGCLIWSVAGVLMYFYPPRKTIKWMIICLGGVGLLMHIIGTYKLSMNAGSIVSTYKGYSNLPCFFYSLGIFIILSDIGKKIMKVEILQKVINFLGEYTFAFYLMHWYVMDMLRNMFHIDTRTIVWRLCAPILIGCIVIIITSILRRIPVIKKIVP